MKTTIAGLMFAIYMPAADAPLDSLQVRAVCDETSGMCMVRAIDLKALVINGNINAAAAKKCALGKEA